MQTKRQSRLAPILKKVALAFAVKKGIDMFEEARRPPKRSRGGRLAKLALSIGAVAGIFYAFVSGKLQPLVDRAMGASRSPDDSVRFDAVTHSGMSGDGGSSASGPSSGDGQSSTLTAGTGTVVSTTESSGDSDLGSSAEEGEPGSSSDGGSGAAPSGTGNGPGSG